MDMDPYDISVALYKPATPKPSEVSLIAKINQIKGLNAELLCEGRNENQLVLRLRVPTQFPAYNSSRAVSEFCEKLAELTGGSYHYPVGDESLYPVKGGPMLTGPKGVFIDIYCPPGFCAGATSELLGTGARPNLRKIANTIFRNQDKIIDLLAGQAISNQTLPGSGFGQR